MKNKKQYNRLLFIFLYDGHDLSGRVFVGLGLFTDIEEEPYVSGETDRIVWGCPSWAVESGWRTANTNRCSRFFTN